MQDRRHDIIEAGLAVLREHGYTGFTEPRVAARAGCVLMALAQAADGHPRLRELFHELVDGIVTGVTRLLRRFGVPVASDEPARLIHALSVGLAVIGLATGRTDNTQRTAGILRAALPSIAECPHGTGPAPNQGDKL